MDWRPLRGLLRLGLLGPQVLHGPRSARRLRGQRCLLQALALVVELAVRGPRWLTGWQRLPRLRPYPLQRN